MLASAVDQLIVEACELGRASRRRRARAPARRAPRASARAPPWACAAPRSGARATRSPQTSRRSEDWCTRSAARRTPTDPSSRTRAPWRASCADTTRGRTRASATPTACTAKRLDLDVDEEEEDVLPEVGHIHHVLSRAFQDATLQLPGRATPASPSRSRAFSCRPAASQAPARPLTSRFVPSLPRVPRPRCRCSFRCRRSLRRRSLCPGDPYAAASASGVPSAAASTATREAVGPARAHGDAIVPGFDVERQRPRARVV